jgi:hypothetical protein
MGSWGQPHGEFDSGRGRWSVFDDGDRWVVDLDVRPQSGFGGKPWAGETILRLIGEAPPYTIHLHVGDPDAGRGMDFVKADPGQSPTGR